jgi:hypothetical protein
MTGPIAKQTFRVKQNKISKCLSEHGGEIMKIGMLAVSVIGLSFIGGALADGLPQMGNIPRIPVTELVEKGYRWATVNGSYACATEREVRQITNDRSDLTELHMVEDGGAYYLIPVTLVRVIRDNQANGMSEILLGGIEKPLLTYNKFLTARAIRDIYGIVETPDTAGLIDPSDPAVARSGLNESSPEGMP